jgi:hypothetical protein
MEHIVADFDSAVTLGSDYEGDYALIDYSTTAARKGGIQVARFFVTGGYTSGSTTGTLHLVLLGTDGNPVWSDTATITIETTAAGSGRRTAKVEFAKTSSDKVDLLGGVRPNGGGSSINKNAVRWKFAITNLGSLDDAQVRVACSEVV